MSRAGRGRSVLSGAAVIAFVCAAVPLSAATVGPVSVPGTSNPYLSGMPDGTPCCGGDTAPANSPAQVVGLTMTAGSSITFAATGSVNNAPGPSGLPPDGGAPISAPSNNGIAGVTAPINSLLGVFLDASLPTSTAAPSGLNFSTIGTNFTTLSPELKQVFFIGDGLTGDGTGSVQRFVVPAGATRLFLGTMDGFGWFNNDGTFSVTASDLAATANLSISKTDSPDPVTVGDTITYSIVVTNGGPDQATNVVVTDTLPASVSFASASSTQGSCSGTSTVTCSLGDLANGASATVTIEVVATSAGTSNNTATVSAAQSDPVQANNTASAETQIDAGEPIPALDPISLAVLALLLASVAFFVMRR